MKGYKQFGYFCLMKWLKRIFDFYLDASIHVALGIISLVQITTLSLNILPDYSLLGFIFCVSISGYNFIKYGVEADKYLVVANQYQKGIQFLSFVTLGFAIYYGFYLNLNAVIVLGLLAFMTGLYALPVLPRAKNLRSLGGLKIFIVALVWAGTTVILPVVSAVKVLSWDVGVETIQRFILVFVLLVPFEIRDLAYDKKELNTLPQSFGVKKTKMFGVFATFLFFFITLLKDDFSQEELILKGILFLTLIIIMLTIKRKQSKYFASFWVEAIPILWFGLWVVVEKFLISYSEVPHPF